MKLLYLDLGMGAAGDMLTAALYELLDDNEKAEFITKMNSLGIDGVSVTARPCEKCGITGTHMEVSVHGAVEGEHEHGHHLDHDHHDHHHNDMAGIKHVITHMPVSDSIKDDIEKVYGLIAEAEGKVHGKEVTQIHFHEVGDKDAIADVAAVCILMDMIAPDRVAASAVCTGYGKVNCAHGILPVPAPATAQILKGIPIYGGDIEGELCTPTGAALVKHFVGKFGPMPQMSVDRTGYGMGTKDFAAANCIRAMLGSTPDQNDDIIELSCNVDDMTPEAVAYAMGVFLDEGAVDAYTVNIGMKKSRPGIMINVMCRPGDKQKFVELIFRHTSTLGIRERAYGRYTLDRELYTFDSSVGEVHIKRSKGYGTTKEKIEYEDLVRIAQKCDLSLDEATELVKHELDSREINNRK